MTRQQVDVTRFYATSDDDTREIKLLFDEFDMEPELGVWRSGGLRSSMPE